MSFNQAVDEARRSNKNVAEHIEDNTVFKLIKRAPYYVIYLERATWNNSSGYKLTSNPAELFMRSYDCVIIPQSNSPRGKWLSCNEYHHDKPTGHRSIFIALTEKEYLKLSSFKMTDISKFVYKTIGDVNL